IRINAICPGMTWTGLATDDPNAEPTDSIMKAQPMNRWGRAEELAAAMLFLASDESSFITGVGLPVDGGYVVP
ncbi:SDR family oxidoreductase, partial [Yinghuangia sp. YIM S10712]|uniref:SDR family oxidoreductase n=1 Tax=Yinghuangia sp. YIM S10712 TaxID=3436930 RepID=UPI003F536D73